jgi:hypothetical protein
VAAVVVVAIEVAEAVEALVALEELKVDLTSTMRASFAIMTRVMKRSPRQ